MLDVTTIVLAGGRGDRLRPLTDCCAKPAVPFAGRRLIDFTLLNCVRSGIQDVEVLVQYRSESVENHLRRTWGKRFTSLRVLSSQALGRRFAGTADAVRAALSGRSSSDRLLVLAGDHIYRMDYRKMLAFHEQCNASATLSVIPVPRQEASRLGVVAVDREGVVEAFQEKPDDPPGIPDRPELSLVSMGIYVFDRTALTAFLHDVPGTTDFGHHVLPRMLDQGHRIGAYSFLRQGAGSYWRDIGDVDAYHGALMDLVCSDTELGVEWPASADAAGPARFREGPGHQAPGVARNAWIGPDSVVAGGLVERSVLGRGVRVEHHAEVIECVLMDGAVVGAHARLRRAVVEAGVRIPPGALIGYGSERCPLPVQTTAGGVAVVSQPIDEPRPSIRVPASR